MRRRNDGRTLTTAATAATAATARPLRVKVLRTSAGGGVQLADASEPVIRDGEVLLELVCCGLCGTDLHKLADRRRAGGEVLGHEIVGRVIESRTEAFAPGDRVVAPHHAPCGSCRLCLSGAETMCPQFAENLLDPGGFGERIRLPARAVEHTVQRIPDGLPDEAAVFVEPAACVLRGIDRSGLGSGPEPPTAVVIGAGSMGLLHLLVLQAAIPDAQVVVVEPDPRRRAMAEQLGAREALHPDAVHGVGSPGADAVLDTAGGQAAFDLALRATRPGGRVVLFAHAPHGALVRFDINALFRSERQIVGAYSGTSAEQARVLDLLVRGALDPTPLVTHRLPFESADEAVELCRRGEALKVLLHP